MKIIRLILITIISLVFCSSFSFAFDLNLDCNQLLSAKTAVQLKITNYKTYGTLKDGTYILCFNPSPDYAATISNTINIQPEDPLLIYGLNLMASASLNEPLVIIKDKVTAINWTLDGKNSTIAIQINGTATIQSNSFTNVATAINVAKEASALVTKGSFTNITTPIAYESGGEGALSADWFGKHASEADATKVDRIAGKLALTNCSGSVEMYLKEKQDKPEEKIYSPSEYHATCAVSELKEKTLELTAADGTKKEIAVGACYFDCDNLTDVLKDNYVSFAYASLPDLKVGTTGATTPLTPSPAAKISELQDVIFASAIPGVGPITSGMDGTDNDGTTIYVTAYGSGSSNAAGSSNSNTVLVDPSVKPQTLGETADDLNGEDADDKPADEQIGQGTSSSAAVGCSIAISSSTDTAQIAWSFFVTFGGISLLVARRRSFRRSRSFHQKACARGASTFGGGGQAQ